MRTVIGARKSGRQGNWAICEIPATPRLLWHGLVTACRRPRQPLAAHFPDAMTGHDAELPCARVGRHTPQHCSGVSSRHKRCSQIFAAVSASTIGGATKCVAAVSESYAGSFAVADVADLAEILSIPRRRQAMSSERTGRSECWQESRLPPVGASLPAVLMLAVQSPLPVVACPTASRRSRRLARRWGTSVQPETYSTSARLPQSCCWTSRR